MYLQLSHENEAPVVASKDFTGRKRRSEAHLIKSRGEFGSEKEGRRMHAASRKLVRRNCFVNKNREVCKNRIAVTQVRRRKPPSQNMLVAACFQARPAGAHHVLRIKRFGVIAKGVPEHLICCDTSGHPTSVRRVGHPSKSSRWTPGTSPKRETGGTSLRISRWTAGTSHKRETKWTLHRAMPSTS